MSDKKFDDKIRETLENHEPDVRPDWGRMKERVAAAAAVGAIGIDIAGSKLISQLSIGVAVVAGAVTMWVAQQYVFPEDTMQEDLSSEQGIQIEEEFNSDAIIVFEDSEDNSNENSVLNNPPSTEGEVEVTLDNKLEVNENGRSNSGDIISRPNDDFDTDNENIVPLELPFAVSTKQACVGIKVDFSLTGSDAKMSFLWNFGDGSFSFEPNPSHIYEEEGVFDVTLSVRSPGDGAIRTRTIENLIEVNPQPDAKLNWELPRIVTNGHLEVELNDETEDTNSSIWVVDGTVTDGSTAEFSVPGTYELNLIASNKFGCQDHASEKIEFGNRTDLRAPARFSPDGDGRYDAFMPFGLYRLVDQWELVISDESGNEIYATTDFNSPWNGLDSSGELAENGSIFYWTVVCTDHSGIQRLYNDVVRVER
jgi:PKD repeat protein